MRKLLASGALAVAVLAGSAVLVSSPSEASTIIGAPDTPNQNWTGSLGLDFTVNIPIVVTALGAYSGPNQYGDITVAIFTSSGVLVSSLEEVIPTSSKSLYVCICDPGHFGAWHLPNHSLGIRYHSKLQYRDCTWYTDFFQYARWSADRRFAVLQRPRRYWFCKRISG